MHPILKITNTDKFLHLPTCSETTPEGRKKTKLTQTLLNGNNICMVCTLPAICLISITKLIVPFSFSSSFQLIPGGEGPEA